MSNLWFIIIAFWFLAPLFRRAKQEKAPQKRSMERRTQPEPTVDKMPRKTEQPFDFPEMPDFPSFPWEQEEKETTRTTQYDTKPAPDDKPVYKETVEIGQDNRWEKNIVQSREILNEAAKSIEGNPIYQKRGETLEVIDLDDENEVTNVSITGFKPKPGDVVQGMIWSQVFGPPRSRLPHKTNRFSRLNRSRHS